MGDGATVEVLHGDYEVEFMPPFAPEGLKDSSLSPAAIAANAEAGAALARYAERARTNVVAAQIGLEETRTLPISQIVLMSNDNFAVYVFKLQHKATTYWGSNEIWSFTTPHVMGIVRVGERFNDRQRAEAILASLDGTRNLVMSVSMLHGSSKDIALALDPILASFQFTIDRVPDRSEIKRLISEAGTPMEPTK
jgi:hypothetical protein